MDGSGPGAAKLDSAALEPIAIVGAACRLPGAADLASFEHLLLSGVDAVTEIPDSRWAKYRYFHPDRGQAGKTYSFAAGVLQDVATFDAAFFGISPREAAQMDPQQRLMLELAHEAIEDAGLDTATIGATSTGVYVGGSSWDYLTLHTGDPALMDAYSMTGATLCSLANRVSFAFDLRGPSLTIDTACSSSLVALHHACEAIRAGQIPLAMVGGVNLLLAPHSFVGFSAASMLSQQGKCHAFDARADGYVRAEGGAMIILRPLREALARGDTIRALIRGTGTNSDGRTTGISLPNQVAQADLLRAVYGRFDLDPQDLCYLEAHGTGTPAGDPIEAAALGEVLGRTRTDPLPIGSVKTNIGHLEAASGMAGLLKAMVVLNSRVVPASLHCGTPNPAIPFASLNLHLVPDQMPVKTAGRLVGVNSFGFGGANAHAVLEAFEQPAANESTTETLKVPLLLSARSMPALRRLAADWCGLLQVNRVDEPMLRAAALARQASRYRMVVNSGSAATMATALTSWLDDRGNYDVVSGEAATGKVAFVFSGNGSQWSGMGEAAAAQNAHFRHALAEVDSALMPLLGWSVVKRLAEPDGWTVKNTSVAQPLLFAVQVAIVQALRHAGIHADIFVGHSVGEVAAAWAAGALRLEQACQVIAARSRLQALTAGCGRMGVLALPAEQAEKALAGTKLVVAAWNASAIVTIAGPAEDIDLLAERAVQEQWAFTPIDLDHAFHSDSMDPLKTPLLADLSKLQPPPCPASFLSTVFGGRVADGARLDAQYWWRNVRDPVRFADAAAEAVARGARILIEVGPQPILQSYLIDALTKADATGRALPTLTRRSPSGRDPIAIIAARCHVAGCDMRGASVFSGPRDHRALPSYPWQRELHWLERSSESSDLTTVLAEHPLLGARRDRGEALEWSNQLGPSLQPWLADHVVGGAIVAPAALLIELALAAAKSRYHSAAALQILDFEITRPLTFEPGALRDVRLRVNEATSQFQIASRARLSDDLWTVHAAGQLARDDTALVARAVPPPIDAGQSIASKTLYDRAAELGLRYEAAFQVVTGVATEGLTRADVTLALPLSGPLLPSGLLLSPTLLDGAFQGLVALASGLLAGEDGVVPWRFGRVCLLRSDGARPHSARLTVTRVGPRSVRADIHVLDASGAPIAELIDCWFVRVQIGAAAARPDSWAYHVTAVASARSGVSLTAGELLDLVVASHDEPASDEAGLLADGFAGYAVAEAFRAALPSPDAPFTIAGLVAVGLIPPDRQERCAELLGWLESDGLASADDGAWRLTSIEDVPTDDILRTLVFETQGTVNDAALLSAATVSLATCLGDGQGAGALPNAALADHFLYASPAGQAMNRALLDRLARIAQAWPQGQPLRVLHVDARRGVVSRQLVRALGSAGGAVQFHALTDAADRPALADALAGFPGAIAECWTVDGPARNAVPFDVIVGSGALTLGSVQVSGLLPYAAGGLLILSEPGPSRLWSLVWPEQAHKLRDGSGWLNALSQAGVEAATSVPAPGSWGGCVLTGRIALAEQQETRTDDTAITLIAARDSALAGAIASSLGEIPVERLLPEEAEAARGTWRGLTDGLPKRIVLVADRDDAVAPWLVQLARSAEAAPDNAHLTMVTRDGPLAASLGGLRRVIANELPDVTCRQITLTADLSATQAAIHVVAEILRPDREPELTWSARGRTVPRLRLGLPAAKTVEAGTPLRLAVTRPGLLDTVGWDVAEALPAPGPGAVAIRVCAAGLNFRDVMWAMGMLPDEALLDGFAGPTLGLECAGEVTAVGAGVTGFVPGDRVMAFAPASLASHTVTAAHAVVRIPEQLSFAAAATIPVAFLTVAYSLGHLARLEAGESVLVHGGAGGVGLAAIQYAKQCGAVVFATAGTPAKRAMLRRLGVDAVLDSRSLSFADEIMRLTNGEGVDVVLNSLSGDAMEASLKLLRPYGRFLELGKRDFYGNTRVGLRPFRHNIAYFGVDVDQLPLRQPKLAASLLGEVAGMLTQGLLRPLPFRSFDATEAPEAFRLMQASGHIGKIVIEFGQPIQARRPRVTIVPAIRRDRQYVVTGGLDGFGLQAAMWLAEHGARQLVLLSRRGAATPGSAAAIDRIRALGAEAVAYTCDVADEAALAGVLETIRDSGVPLGGVIHAAVVMDDGLLPAIDEDRFARALRPKLEGTAALDRLTRRDPIELFIVFSSVTSVLGNPGQANYVAANAAAEAVIEARCRVGLPGLAVQWGPIGDAGYLTREGAVADLLSKRLGERLMTAAEALAGLPTLIASGLPVAGLARMRWGQMGVGLPLLQSPMYDAVRGDPAEGGEAIDLAAMLASCTPEEAQAKLGDMLADEVGRIMRMPSASIPRHRPLAELGMDSLMAVELRMAVEQRFGLTLPVLALSDGVTLTAIAGRMARSKSETGSARENGVKAMAERIGRYEHVQEPVQPVVELAEQS